jgi:hypothetical protein
LKRVKKLTAAGGYLPEGHHPNIPGEEKNEKGTGELFSTKENW